MMHRIRYALAQPEFTNLKGVVEMDDNLYGEKQPAQENGDDSPDRNKTASYRSFSAVGKRGRLCLNRVTAENLHRRSMNTSWKARLSHDIIVLLEHAPVYDHKSIKHSQRNTTKRGRFQSSHEHLLNQNSHFKTRITGTFHQVSKKHLPLYLAFDHRFNPRKIRRWTFSALNWQKGSG